MLVEVGAEHLGVLCGANGLVTENEKFYESSIVPELSRAARETVTSPARQSKVRAPLSAILAVLVIATLILPSLTILGGGLRLTLLLYVAWLTLSLVGRKHFAARMYREVWRRRLEFGMLACWLLTVLANAALGRGPGAFNHSVATIMLVAIVSIEAAYTPMGEGVRRWIVAASTIALAFDAIRSLPLLWAQPGLPREVMEPGTSPDFVREQALLGVGDYNLYTGNAIVLPLLIATALAFRGITRTLLLLACVAIALAVTLSTFAGAFALLVLGLVALAVAHLRGGRMNVKHVFVVTFVVISVAGSWFSFVGDTEQGRFVTEKLVLLAGGVSEQGLSGDQTGRADLFMLSLRTFSTSPLVGIGPVTTVWNDRLLSFVGGHSSWIDQLAEYGVLGFGPFLVFVGLTFRRILRAMVKTQAELVNTARVITAGLFLIGGVVNPVVFVPNVLVSYFLLALLGEHGGARGRRVTDSSSNVASTTRGAQAAVR